MRIDLDSIDRSDFAVIEGEIPVTGRVVLIRPHKRKQAWSDADRHLRSLLCRPTGEVVSSGFPKFHNVGEDPALDAITSAAVASGAAHFTEKIDGSLIIRDVIDGRVHFRTRGNVDLGDFGPLVMPLARERYPALLDPCRGIGAGILMEFTHPETTVILRYPDPSLTALGLVSHRGDSLAVWGDTGDIDRLRHEFGIPGPRIHKMPLDVGAAREIVAGWRDSEGVVAWCPVRGGYHLAKLKADRYLRLHALRFSTSPERLHRLCVRRDLRSLDALRAAAEGAGMDWEVFAFLAPDFEAFCERRAEVEERARRFCEAIDREGIRDLPTRGEVARALQDMTGPGAEWRGLFHLGIAHATGETVKAREYVNAAVLGVSATQYRSAMSEPDEWAAEGAEGGEE